MKPAPPTLSEVTVVITTHDPGPALLDLLADLFACGSFAAVHMVDSGSAEDALDQAQQQYPDVQITRLGANLGPCVARNRGWKVARSPYVLFVDDDMRLDRDCAPRLLAALAADEGLALAGARILRADDRAEVQYEGGLWHYAGLPHMRGGCLPPDAPAPCVNIITTSCVLARRSALQAAGGFDETLFFLMEDAELSLRLGYLGWRMVAVPGARSWNAGGSTGLSLEHGGHPELRLRLHARNRFMILLGLYDAWTLVVLAPGLVLLDLAWFLFCLLQGHPLAFVRGRASALRALPGVLEKRARFLPRKCLRDSQLLAAPALTLTREASSSSLVVVATRLLDHMLRCYWCLARRLLP